MTSVLDASLMPLAVIHDVTVRHNIDAFAAYCATHNVELAPHVKTTMSPELFALQREAGAWGATVANVPQARTVYGWGEKRLLIANELADPTSLAWIVDVLQRDSGSEIYFWVDSLEGVRLAMREHELADATRPLSVLVELGYEGGRGGCRSAEEAAHVGAVVAASPRLRLCGVAGYEGTIHGPDLPRRRAAVDRYLDEIRAVFEELQRDNLFEHARPFVSAGGSAFVDRVAMRLGSRVPALRVLVRSGCYVTHDCGLYDRDSALGGPNGILKSALEVWAPVLSTPERSLALLGLGRRDVSFDAGLPVPSKWRRGDGRITALPPGLELFELNDQHAYIRDERDVLSVGDLVGVCISHPCTTFDKWRGLELVNGEYERVGTVSTHF